MSDLVTLKIDGVEVSVPPGTLIVEAAKQAGNEIPVFCYHSKLESVGMCRMCLVTMGMPVRDRQTGDLQRDENGEPVIRFFPKPVTSCTTPVSEGMVVITQSEESLADRQAVLEFLLTSHPLDCPVCDKGGECALQDLTYAHGPGLSRFQLDDKHHGPKKYPLGDLIVLDTERCIICARCVRFQDEIAGDAVLAIENRGRDARIVSYSTPPFDSKYSGNTTDICPVGALTTRDFRFGARSWELTNVPSVCNLCGAGCNTVLGTRNNAIKRVMPRQNEAVNEIWLCDKGRFGHHFNGSQQRLTSPLIKKDGRFVEASWNEALTLVAEKFRAAGDKIGGLAGPHLSNEDLYVFQKLFRSVLHSHNIDHRTGLSAALFDDDLTHQVGAGVGTDLGRLSNKAAMLVLGADLDEESPILYLRARASARRGAHLMTANARWTKLDSVAGQSLRLRPGSVAHLVWGMVAAILEEGLEAKEFSSARLTGLDDLRAALSAATIEEAAVATGLPADDIRQAAKAFAQAEDGLILFGLEAGNDPALRAGIKALALLTGHAGRANNGVIAVLPHANSRGAADLGVLPHRLPGYAPVEGEAGLSAEQMLSAESSLQALYLAAANPAAESEAYRAALEAIDFVVVQELFLTETAQLADVVLPARAVAERDGSFTSVERWVQAYDIGLTAPPLAWADWLITTALAGRLGADWAFASADGVMAEITRTVPLYRAMSFENLTAPLSVSRQMSHYVYSGMSFRAESREGLQWPTLAEDAAASLAVEYVAPAPAPVADGHDLLLVSPRTLYDGGVLIAQAEVVAAHIQQPAIAVSKKDAARLRISAGDTVTVTAGSESHTMPVAVNRLTPAGTAVIARNLAGSPAERLLGGKLVAPVKITKVAVSEPA